MAENDARSVYSFSGENTTHEVLITVVDQLALLQSRGHIVDYYLVQKLVAEGELGEWQGLAVGGILHPLANAKGAVRA